MLHQREHVGFRRIGIEQAKIDGRAFRLELGDPAAARREVEQMLESAGRRKERDPLWLYPWGPAVGVDERLAAMKLEASTP